MIQTYVQYNTIQYEGVARFGLPSAAPPPPRARSCRVSSLEWGLFLFSPPTPRQRLRLPSPTPPRVYGCSPRHRSLPRSVQRTGRYMYFFNYKSSAYVRPVINRSRGTLLFCRQTTVTPTVCPSLIPRRPKLQTQCYKVSVLFLVFLFDRSVDLLCCLHRYFVVFKVEQEVKKEITSLPARRDGTLVLVWPIDRLIDSSLHTY